MIEISRKLKALATAGFLAAIASAGTVRADDTAELRKLLEIQSKQIEELKHRLDAVQPARNSVLDSLAAGEVPSANEESEEAGGAAPAALDDPVKKIVSKFLEDNPGAGMPPGVQTGWYLNQGFVIKSPDSPKYIKWDDECRIPFELRIRGRLQIPYEYYKVTDTVNHQLHAPANFPTPAQFVNRLNRFGLPGENSAGDFDQLEIKRMRLIFEGTAFDPDLRYHIQLDGGTRGIAGLANGTATQGVGGVALGGDGLVTVDHAMRLFSAYVAYDFHPCCSQKGCGLDCPDGTFKYSPTITAIAGKFKPFFGLEEYLGSANEQFVEYSMADWYFDADDDNLLMGVGTQIKALDDRFYLQAIMTNGNETQIANLQMDHMPGFNVGFWYDFGGTWNEARKRWDLYGDSIADVDYSCKPVLRVGAATDLVPMDRRSLYTDAEENRVRAMPAAPGGSTVLGLLDGGGVPSLVGLENRFSADKFNSYSFNAFWGAKFKGFSLYQDWWVRDLQGFKGARAANGATNPIFFSAWDPVKNTRIAALFTKDNLVDYGQTIQGGYFIVPKRLEVCGRFSWVCGQSGSIQGSVANPGNTPTQTIAGQPGIHIIPDAFQKYASAYEYAVGVNYYWKRQQLKWQTDLGLYDGGNPATGGQSPAGFIPGVDGWMLRTQIQLFF